MMEEKKQVVVVEQKVGCFAQIFGLVFWLILFPLIECGTIYLVYNWQLNNFMESRLNTNESVIENLSYVLEYAEDLSTLDIVNTNDNTGTAKFSFYNQSTRVGRSYELNTENISFGVFKIRQTPKEWVFGLPQAKWLYDKAIAPNLPEYSYLLITPAAIEYCETPKTCRVIKRCSGFADVENEFSFFF